jgi:hypothetical protein
MNEHFGAEFSLAAKNRSARILRAVRRHLAFRRCYCAGRDARDPHAGCVRSSLPAEQFVWSISLTKVRRLNFKIREMT